MRTECISGPKEGGPLSSGGLMFPREPAEKTLRWMNQ